MPAVFLPKENISYVHIPRTGGTSICNWFANNFSDCCFLDFHPQIEEIHKKFDAENYFTVVRNPWERVVSAYNFVQQNKRFWGVNPVLSNVSFDKFVDKLQEVFYESNGEIASYLPSKNQTDWIDQRVLIIRYENLSKDFRKIQESTKCFIPLPHLNKSVHSHYSNFYNSKTRNLVGRIFEKDIDELKYTF